MPATTGGGIPILSELGAALGETDYVPQYIDKSARELELGLTGGAKTALAQLPDYLRNYRRAMARNAPALGAATTDYSNALRNILNRPSNMSELTGLGDYLFGKVQQVPNRVIDYFGNTGDVNNMARGLYPGAQGQPSTYRDVTRGGIATRAALEANRSALGALQSLFPSQQAASLARDAALQGILPAIQAGYQGLEQRALAPWQAYLGGLGNLQGFGIGQNALRGGNLQGFRPDRNAWARISDASQQSANNFSQILDWAQQAASIYGSVLGGGMGGGGMGGLGGLFGGGGGGTPATNAYPGMNSTGAAMLNQNPAPFGTTYNPYTNSSQYFWGS